jgi:hypothetical protein
MMSQPQTIIALARELETIEQRRAEILQQIAFAAGPAAPPVAPSPDVDPRQLTVPGTEPAPAQASHGPRSKGYTDAILSALAESPSGISVTTIAERTGLPAKIIRSTLSLAGKRGKAECISRGVWGPGRP